MSKNKLTYNHLMIKTKNIIETKVKDQDKSTYNLGTKLKNIQSLVLNS